MNSALHFLHREKIFIHRCNLILGLLSLSNWSCYPESHQSTMIPSSATNKTREQQQFVRSLLAINVMKHLMHPTRQCNVYCTCLNHSVKPTLHVGRTSQPSNVEIGHSQVQQPRLTRDQTKNPPSITPGDPPPVQVPLCVHKMRPWMA